LKLAIFSTPFVEKAFFTPLYVFGEFVKSKWGIAVWIHIWVIYSVPVFISVLCQYHSVFIAMAL
jgi:hypothetical protein